LLLSTSFKVLAQDCSQQKRCVILMRKLSETSDLKQVKIITDNNKILITPVSENDEQIKIFINGRKYPINQIDEINENLNELPIKINREGSEIKVELLNCGVTVNFNGLTCTIEKCSRRSVRLCGPCGKTNVERDNVFGKLYKKDFSNEYCNTDYECKYNKRCENVESCRYNEDIEREDDEETPFWERLFQDDDFEVPTLKSRKHHNLRRNYGESRRPTFWGLEKDDECEFGVCRKYDNERRYQRKTNFWGLDKEPVDTLFDDIYENRERSLFDEDEDDLEVPTMRSSRRSFWGQSRKPTTFTDSLFDDVYENRERSFYDNDDEVPTMKHQRSFWGQSRKPTTFWGLDKEQEHENKFWGQDSDDFENVNEYESENKRMVLKHKIMEVENKVCISLERIPECLSNSHPINKMEKRVVYTCLHRNDPEVNQLESRIHRGESVRHIVERMTPSKTRTEVVPTKCTKMF